MPPKAGIGSALIIGLVIRAEDSHECRALCEIAISEVTQRGSARHLAAVRGARFNQSSLSSCLELISDLQRWDQVKPPISIYFSAAMLSAAAKRGEPVTCSQIIVPIRTLGNSELELGTGR